MANETRWDLDTSNIDADYRPKRLEKITTYVKFGSDSIQKKEYEFTYAYANGASSPAHHEKRLRLDELEISNGNLALPPYKFTYIENAEMPSRLSYAKDIWGYCNWETDNDTIKVPEIYVYKNLTGSDRFRLFNVQDNNYPYDEEFVLFGANGQPNGYATSGTLEKMEYPTGGYIEFEYEDNQYIYDTIDDNTYDGAGIRIIKKTVS